MSQEKRQAHGAVGRRMLALAVALDHPALSADACILCTLACVCKDWRQAVQQSSGCNTAVVIGPEFDFSWQGQTVPLVKLSSFAQWLPAHAALVKSIKIDTQAMRHLPYHHDHANPMPLGSFKQVARQLMRPALESAAAGTAAATVQGPQQQQQRGLRLVSFTADLLGMPGMLAALPAHTLTHLDLDLWASTAIDGPGLGAALARLSSLQHLKLTRTTGRYGDSYSIPTSCLEGIAQLTRLTYLGLGGMWTGERQQLQQLLAQPLPLQRLDLHLNLRIGLPKLALTGCSQLRELSVATNDGLPRGSALPLQLQRLKLDYGSNSDNVIADLQLQLLQQLSHLTLDIPMASHWLRSISQLQSLQHVGLGCSVARDAHAGAAIWQQIPQLRELTVLHRSGGAPVGREMWDIVDTIAACSGLTELQLDVRSAKHEQDPLEAEDSEDDDDHAYYPTMACGALAALTNLQDLCLTPSSRLVEADALQLTALTGLTRLVLGGLKKGVGELAATSIACNLKQLQHLDLQDCDLGSVSCLAAIAHLPKLTELKLQGNKGLTQLGLMQLTRLSSLQKLGTDDPRDLMTPLAWSTFWACVRGQRAAW